MVMAALTHATAQIQDYKPMLAMAKAWDVTQETLDLMEQTAHTACYNWGTKLKRHWQGIDELSRFCQQTGGCYSTPPDFPLDSAAAITEFLANAPP